jgi:hypothetical protein
VTPAEKKEAVPRAPALPPLEFIASSTQLESTRDWFTVRIVELMGERRVGFVEAARVAAHDNLTGYGEHATRSARPDPLGLFDDAPVRQALVLAVARPRGEHADPELPRVAEQLAPDGIATRALESDYGAEHMRILHDPTAAEMRIALQDGIDELGKNAARSGRRGELTLFFDGHGDSAGMAGADGEELTFDELQDANRRAVAANVQLIVVSNGCFQGAGVVLAERLVNAALEARVQSARLAPKRAEELSSMLAAAGQLIEFARKLSPVLEELGRIAGASPHAATPTEAVRALYDSLEALDGEHGFAEASTRLNAHIESARTRLAKIDPDDPEQLGALVADLNVVSDSLTEEVAQLQELVGVQLDLAAIVPPA